MTRASQEGHDRNTYLYYIFANIVAVVIILESIPMF